MNIFEKIYFSFDSKLKSALTLVFALSLLIVSSGCSGAAQAGKNDGGGETNVAEAREKLAACGRAKLAEAAAQKTDLIIAADEFAEAENFACAEAVCDEFDRRFPEHFARHECRGNVRFKQKQYAQALVFFDRLVAAKPTYSYGLLQRSFVHEKLGDLNRALADADAAFKLVEAEAEQPDTRAFAAKTLVQRGYVQFLQGANELALKDYDRAVELHPNGHPAYTARSFVRRKLGQTALADADERRGKELKQANKEGNFAGGA